MSFFSRLVAVFFPDRCCVCDSVVYPGQKRCPSCEKLIIHYPPKRAACRVCGMERRLCPCARKVLYTHSTVPLFYEKEIKGCLHKMKFRGRLDFIKPFGEMIAQSLIERKDVPKPDLITFVPMSKKSKYKRGYNQSELLAEAVGKQTEIPVTELIYKYSAAKTQHSSGYSRRHGNVLGIFEPKTECLSLIEGKHILVIDDIITTGSTLNEIAKTLLIFGAEKVSVAAVAQGKSRRKQRKKVKTASSAYMIKPQKSQARENENNEQQKNA